MKKIDKINGFTLIELLIVMAIIGVLVIVSIGSFQSSQIRTRDTRRKNDLEQIGRALEIYYNDKGQYPDNSTDFKLNACEDLGSGPTTCDWGEEWSDENGTIYTVDLPADQNVGFNYYYLSDGSYYQLYARLENDEDGAIPTIAESPANYGISCGVLNCNYGIASSNKMVDAGRIITLD